MSNSLNFPILKGTGEQKAYLPEYKDSEVRDIYKTQLDKQDTNVIYKILSGSIKEYDLTRDPGSGITFAMKRSGRSNECSQKNRGSAGAGALVLKNPGGRGLHYCPVG